MLTPFIIHPFKGQQNFRQNSCCTGCNCPPIGAIIAPIGFAYPFQYKKAGSDGFSLPLIVEVYDWQDNYITNISADYASTTQHIFGNVSYLVFVGNTNAHILNVGQYYLAIKDANGAIIGFSDLFNVCSTNNLDYIAWWSDCNIDKIGLYYEGVPRYINYLWFAPCEYAKDVESKVEKTISNNGKIVLLEGSNTIDMYYESTFGVLTVGLLEVIYSINSHKSIFIHRGNGQIIPILNIDINHAQIQKNCTNDYNFRIKTLPVLNSDGCCTEISTSIAEHLLPLPNYIDCETIGNCSIPTNISFTDCSFNQITNLYECFINWIVPIGALSVEVSVNAGTWQSVAANTNSLLISILPCEIATIRLRTICPDGISPIVEYEYTPAEIECILPQIDINTITHDGFTIDILNYNPAAIYAINLLPINETNWINAEVITIAAPSTIISGLAICTTYSIRLYKTCPAIGNCPPQTVSIQSGVQTLCCEIDLNIETLILNDCNTPFADILINALNAIGSYTIEVLWYNGIAWQIVGSQIDADLSISLQPNNYLAQVTDSVGCIKKIPFSISDGCNCATPINLQDLAISETSVTIVWTNITGATYTVKWKKATDLVWLVTTSPTNAITLTGLEPCTAYDIIVQSICGTETSDFSIEYSFDTLCDCGEVTPECNNIACIEPKCEVNQNGELCFHVDDCSTLEAPPITQTTEYSTDFGTTWVIGNEICKPFLEGNQIMKCGELPTITFRTGSTLSATETAGIYTITLVFGSPITAQEAIDINNFINNCGCNGIFFIFSSTDFGQGVYVKKQGINTAIATQNDLIITIDLSVYTTWLDLLALDLQSLNDIVANSPIVIDTVSMFCLLFEIWYKHTIAFVDCPTITNITKVINIINCDCYTIVLPNNTEVQVGNDCPCINLVPQINNLQISPCDNGSATYSFTIISPDGDVNVYQDTILIGTASNNDIFSNTVIAIGQTITIDLLLQNTNCLLTFDITMPNCSIMGACGDCDNLTITNVNVIMGAGVGDCIGVIEFDIPTECNDNYLVLFEFDNPNMIEIYPTNNSVSCPMASVNIVGQTVTLSNVQKGDYFVQIYPDLAAYQNLDNPCLSEGLVIPCNDCPLALQVQSLIFASGAFTYDGSATVNITNPNGCGGAISVDLFADGCHINGNSGIGTCGLDQTNFGGFVTPMGGIGNWQINGLRPNDYTLQVKRGKCLSAIIHFTILDGSALPLCDIQINRFPMIAFAPPIFGSIGCPPAFMGAFEFDIYQFGGSGTFTVLLDSGSGFMPIIVPPPFNYAPNFYIIQIPCAFISSVGNYTVRVQDRGCFVDRAFQIQ